MKLYRIFPALMLAGAMATVTGCDEDPVLPPMIVPESDLEPNTTILDIKTRYWNDDRNFIDTIGLTDGGEHVIIRGRVTSSDESGNFFKYLTIQDETAALCFSINNYDIFESYHYGQEVFIDMTDMEIGKYSSEFLVGKAEWYDSGNTWEAGRMDITTLNDHAELNGLPDGAEVDTLTMTIDQIQAIADNTDDMRLYGHRLVRIDNVTVSGAGNALASYQVTGWHTLTDATGNTLVLPVSGYCDYWSEKTPEGTGSVVGILCYKYSANDRTTCWQLWTRSYTDFIGFDKNVEPEPEVPVDPISELDVTFDGVTDISGLEGWTKAEIKGNKDWYFTTFNNNAYAAVTAYKGTSSDGYEAWLITPPLNVDAMKEKVLSFETQARYSGTDELKAFALTSADPATAQLTELPATICPHSGASSSDWISSGEVSLSGFSGTIYIGFRYTAEANQSGYVTYGLDNVVAGKKAGSTPPVVDPEAGTADNPYTVTEVIALGNPGTQAWVKGYIVGWLNGQYTTDAQFSSSATVAGNLLIAASASETDVTKCVAVQLPAGSVRDALNLRDNAGNYKAEVVLYGTLDKYVTDAGLKNVTDYRITGSGDDPVTPPSGNATFTLAQSVTSGERYALVHASEVVVPISETYTYGYLYVEAVTIVNDSFTTSTANSFLFTAVTGGFTIQDTYGRYLYMDATHTSFQLSATMPADGGVWTVEHQGAGAFKITNVMTGKYTQFATQYNSFGNYAEETGDHPVLYQMAQ